MIPLRLRLTLLIWILGALLAGPIEADDYGVVLNGAWNDPATWTPAGGPPTASDNAYLGTGFPELAIAPVAVQLVADESAAFVNIGRGELDLNDHTLTANALLMDSTDGAASVNKSGGHVEIEQLLLFGGSSFAVEAGDELTFSASVDGAGSMLSLSRPLSLVEGVAVIDNGVVNTSASLTALGFGLQITGATVNAGANVTASSTFYGAGITSGGILNLNGHTLNAGVLYLGAGRYQVIGGLATLDRGSGGSVVLGSIDVNSGNTFTLEAVDNLSASIRVADAGSALILNRNVAMSGSADVVDHGILDVHGHVLSSGGSTSLLTGGQLTGNGEIVGAIHNISGVIAPGESAGVLSVVGNYDQQDDGVLRIELGGTDNSIPLSAEFDQLIVDGTASLGGQLSVSLLPSFSPSVGDVFPIVTATGGIQMAFSAITYPDIASTLQWQIDDSDTHSLSLFVSPALQGDYNANGVVDAADYTVWRNSRGQSGIGLAADGSGNGHVGDEDYDFWKQKFGSALGSGSGGLVAAQVVPEPGSVVFLAAIAIASAFIQCRIASLTRRTVYCFDNFWRRFIGFRRIFHGQLSLQVI
jgi:hypothetical protein